MLKMTGIILILLSGAALGFGQSWMLSGREKNLEAILRMILLLKGEIRFGNTSLADAFSAVSARTGGELGKFLTALSEETNSGSGRSFGEIFRSCASEKLSGMLLSDEERETLYALGGSLGYLDQEMQLRQLELFEEDLELALHDLRLEMPSKKKVYQSLGVMGAVLLAVLVW